MRIRYCGNHDFTSRNRASWAFAVLVAGLAATAPGAAQGADIAHVELVTGVVDSTGAGHQLPLDLLDTIGARTRLVLHGNSELRVCHYPAKRLITLKGPLQAEITEAGATGESGAPVGTLGAACAPPVSSTIQGGIITRSLIGSAASANLTTAVSLQPAVKVVSRGNQINSISVWDNPGKKVVTTFDRDRNVARLDLAPEKSYRLVIEMTNGKNLEMILRASAKTSANAVVVEVP